MERRCPQGQVSFESYRGKPPESYAAPPEASIEWHEAPAERMPLPDGSFDVVRELLARRADPQMAGFLGQVFSLHDPGESSRTAA